VTSLPDEILTIAQHYRDRGDSENHFDALKNQWGWCGFTTQDLKRCRLMSRMIALIYNWWTLFVRFAEPNNHQEAITSRPLRLQAVGRKTQQAGQQRLSITRIHRDAGQVQQLLTGLNRFFKQLRESAEQFSVKECWRRMLHEAFSVFLRKNNGILIALPVPTG